MKKKRKWKKEDFKNKAADRNKTTATIFDLPRHELYVIVKYSTNNKKWYSFSVLAILYYWTQEEKNGLQTKSKEKKIKRTNFCCCWQQQRTERRRRKFQWKRWNSQGWCHFCFSLLSLIQDIYYLLISAKRSCCIFGWTIETVGTNKRCRRDVLQNFRSSFVFCNYVYLST